MTSRSCMNSTDADSWLVSSTSTRASSGRPALAKPSRRTAAMAMFDWMARRRAPQEGGVARLEAQAGGVAGDVGPVLVDDRHDAERHPHPARCAGRWAGSNPSTTSPTGSGSAGDLAQAARHALEPRRRLSRSRSTTVALVPACSARSTSAALAARISAVRSTSRSAAARSAASLAAGRRQRQRPCDAAALARRRARGGRSHRADLTTLVRELRSPWATDGAPWRDRAHAVRPESGHGRRRRQPLASALARAFATTDPVMVFLHADGRHRNGGLLPRLRAAKLHLPQGDVYDHRRHTSARAIWAPPERGGGAPARPRRPAGLSCASSGRPRTRLVRALRTMTAVEGKHPEGAALVPRPCSAPTPTSRARALAIGAARADPAALRRRGHPRLPRVVEGLEHPVLPPPRLRGHRARSSLAEGPARSGACGGTRPA